MENRDRAQGRQAGVLPVKADRNSSMGMHASSMHCNVLLFNVLAVTHKRKQADTRVCKPLLRYAAPVSRSIARMAAHGSRASVRSSVRGSQMNTSRMPRRGRDGRPDNRVRHLP